MRNRNILGVLRRWYYLAAFALMVFLPIRAEALDVYEKAISKNETWYAKNSPYYIYGKVTVQKGTTLKIEKGAHVFMKGGGEFMVNGSLLFQGAPQGRIDIVQDPASFGLSVKGGVLDFDYVNISNGQRFIDAYDKSSINILNTTLSDSSGGLSGVSVWKNSSLTIADSNFVNIHKPYVIEIWNGTEASISNTQFSDSGNVSSIAVYGSGDLSSTANIENITVANGKGGVEIFEGAIARVSESSFDKIAGPAISMHNGATVEILKSNFINNHIGVEGYNSP